MSHQKQMKSTRWKIKSYTKVISIDPGMLFLIFFLAFVWFLVICNSCNWFDDVVWTTDDFIIDGCLIYTLLNQKQRWSTDSVNLHQQLVSLVFILNSAWQWVLMDLNIRLRFHRYNSWFLQPNIQCKIFNSHIDNIAKHFI